MKVHDVTIFADKSFIPKFDTLDGFESITLDIHSGSSILTSPKITIFFENLQEATNFKNAVIQSWEAFLKETKEKS